MKKINRNTKLRRRARVRAKIAGTESRPRLVVYRSHRYIYAQIIDDDHGKTIVGTSEKELKTDKKQTKIEIAKLLGKLLAEKGLKLGVKQVVFDRGSYKYHGRVKSMAQGAREGGLQF